MNSTTAYRAVKAIAYGMFGTGLALSVTHTYDFFHTTLGAATVTAAAMPMFFDGVQIIGKLMRSEAFTAHARKIGLRVQCFGALLSLIANAVGGHTWGDRIAGVILVLGYIGAEMLAEVIRPATEDAAVIATTQAATKSAAASARAKKAAATRAANKAEAARKAAEKAERAKLARLAKRAEIDALNETYAAYL